MSAYTTQQAIGGEIQQADLIQLCDDVGTGSLDAAALAILNQVIANASGEVDQACANLYGRQLPFNPVPSSVASMALTITLYKLYRRRLVPDEQNKYWDSYKIVRDFLNRINTGEAQIDDVVSRDFPPVVFTGRSTIYGNRFSNFPSSSM